MPALILVSKVSAIINSSRAVDVYVKKLSPEIKPAVELLRRIILTSSEHIKEELRHGIPFYMYKGQLCYINPFDNKIVLGFSRGADLNDEHRMLIGGGRSVRHVVLKTGIKIDEEKIRHLIYEALIVNEMKADNRKYFFL